MNLHDFTADEQQLLVELLDREIPNLREEISNTDDYEYRESLKQGEKRLRELIRKLKAS